MLFLRFVPFYKCGFWAQAQKGLLCKGGDEAGQNTSIIYIDIVLKYCGGFWVFPPGTVRTHLKTSVQKYLDLHRTETTRPLNFLPLPPID